MALSTFTPRTESHTGRYSSYSQLCSAGGSSKVITTVCNTKRAYKKNQDKEITILSSRNGKEKLKDGRQVVRRATCLQLQDRRKTELTMV